MQPELKEIIDHLKKQLPKRGAYKRIAELSGGSVNVSKVKHVFAYGSASHEATKKTLEAAKKFVKERQWAFDELKKLAGKK